MKKIYTLLAVALAAWSNASAAPVYSSSFNTQEEFDEWTVVDENEDGSTWTFYEGNNPGRRTYYNYNPINAAQDWFISPAITLPEEGRYIVKYGFNGSAYLEDLEVYCAASPDIASLSEGLMNAHYNLEDVPYTSYFLVQAEAGQTIYVAFKAVSGPDKFQLRLQSISVELAGSLSDIVLHDITTPVTGANLGEEKVTLLVGNAEGMDPINGFDATISLDGVEMFTEHIDARLEAGQTREFTLDGTLDLSVGHRNYQIAAKVSCEGDVAEGNNSCSVTVRHEAPATEPYFMGFEAEEDLSGHKFFDLNDDGSHWHIYTAGWFDNFANTGYKCLAYNYNAENAGDDWCILEGIQCEAGYHALKFWYSSLDDRHQEKFSVHWGTEQTPEGMTNDIVTYAPFTSAPYVESCNVIYLEEPAVIYIGFHSFSDPDQNWIIIDDITLEPVSPSESDFVLYDLQYPIDFAPEKWHDNAKFSIQNNGMNNDSAVVKISLDGKEVYSEAIEMQPFEKRTLEAPVPISSLEVGEHSIEIQAVNEHDPNPENSVLSTTFRKLGVPALSWDFEDGVVPESFTLRNEGWYKLHPDAIEEWGETGWATLPIEKHELFGQYILGGSCYLENQEYASDIWMVLPHMTVDSADACASWMAMPLGINTESYQFYVSDGDDGWWNYSVLFENKNLDDVTTGAADLSQYEGKQIYVAFRLNTIAGDAVGFDNINLYGVSLVPTSTDKIFIVKGGLMVSEGMVKADGASSITVYDMTGKTVRSSNGESIDITSLDGGIYIARAITAEGTKVLKFRK